MKVWIVSPAYDYEGLGSPEKVFAKEEDAKAWVNKQKYHRDWDITEMAVE